AYLAAHAGEVVSHEELLERFWQGTFTSDHAVHKVIAELRSALGDNAHSPLYIRTIPKRGYSVIADVQREPSAASIPPPSSPVPALPATSSFWRLDKRLLAGSLVAAALVAVFLWPMQRVSSDRDEVARL